ncbi:MAG: FtsW/RodA/SpoVE family cell cycle protein [Candidatus Pacebacteria bacterium]|nr:FtsW/RodA/SpoVE family cell cycle protein [Candidatus Paceibacterota bacterium]
MANRAKNNTRPNITLAIAISVLVFLGFLALATATTPASIKAGASPSYYLFHQVLYGLLPGLLLGFIAFKIPLRFYKEKGLIIFVIAFILMVAVFIPAFSKTEGGATRWLNLGYLSFQPSEFLKLATIIYLAAILSSNRPNKKKFVAFLFALALIAVSLILQSNLSTLVIISAVAGIVFFCASTPWIYNIGVWAAGLLLFAVLALEPYRFKRISVFLNSATDPLGIGYQLKQALIAIGSGGLIGSGLGFSSQKFGFLPESTSDSIFAIYAEETGFIGCFFLIAAFVVFAATAFFLARKVTDNFSKLVAIGIGSWISIQAFVNIGAMTGLLPLSGTPLPFITYGSSHLVFELIACGILLNISASAKDA